MSRMLFTLYRPASAGDGSLRRHIAELPEGSRAVQSQEVRRGNDPKAETFAPQLAEVFFCPTQVSEAQIEASLARSPGSQLSLKVEGIKSSYDSGAVSLALSDQPV